MRLVRLKPSEVVWVLSLYAATMVDPKTAWLVSLCAVLLSWLGRFVSTGLTWTSCASAAAAHKIRQPRVTLRIQGERRMWMYLQRECGPGAMCGQTLLWAIVVPWLTLFPCSVAVPVSRLISGSCGRIRSATVPDCFGWKL